jgi:two-component system response regulator BaeR
MGTTPAANPATILIVEDEERLARLVADYLTLAGYNSHTLGEGTGVVDWVRAHQPALVILDLMLPGRDGLDVCRDLRAFSAVPIIMTTARVEEIDRLLGLELGADDYLCKPFSPRELVARVKAVLRRFQAPPASFSPTGTGASPIGAGATAPARQAGATPTSPTGSGLTGATPASTSSTGLTGATPTPTTGIGLTGSPPPAASPAALDLEESTLRVHWQGRTVELTAVEFSLLATLYASPGRIFSRNRLMALIYRDHRVVSDRTIDSHIKKLRRKLEELSTDQEWVHSVYGVGYRYEEQD